MIMVQDLAMVKAVSFPDHLIRQYITSITTCRKWCWGRFGLRMSLLVNVIPSTQDQDC